jgi:hypothetical protein
MEVVICKQECAEYSLFYENISFEEALKKYSVFYK